MTLSSLFSLEILFPLNNISVLISMKLYRMALFCNISVVITVYKVGKTTKKNKKKPNIQTNIHTSKKKKTFCFCFPHKSMYYCITRFQTTKFRVGLICFVHICQVYMDSVIKIRTLGIFIVSNI